MQYPHCNIHNSHMQYPHRFLMCWFLLLIHFSIYSFIIGMHYLQTRKLDILSSQVIRASCKNSQLFLNNTGNSKSSKLLKCLKPYPNGKGTFKVRCITDYSLGISVPPRPRMLCRTPHLDPACCVGLHTSTPHVL